LKGLDSRQCDCDCKAPYLNASRQSENETYRATDSELAIAATSTVFSGLDEGGTDDVSFFVK